jgi:metal-responsive CopG/Arc/MetJ family transcriptional regulator
MSKTKVAITIDTRLLAQLDNLVAEKKYKSRSRAIQEAVEEKFIRLNHNRLARESAKLDPLFEQALAEEGLSEDLSEWPEY